jgi:hypothetical protein
VFTARYEMNLLNIVFDNFLSSGTVFTEGVPLPRNILSYCLNQVKFSLYRVNNI